MPCFKMKFFHFFSHSTPILGKGGSQPRPPTAASSATTIQVHQMARMVEGLLLQQPNRQRTAITSRSVIGISNAARSNEVSGNSFFWRQIWGEWCLWTVEKIGSHFRGWKTRSFLLTLWWFEVECRNMYGPAHIKPLQLFARHRNEWKSTY